MRKGFEITWHCKDSPLLEKEGPMDIHLGFTTIPENIPIIIQNEMESHHEQKCEVTPTDEKGIYRGILEDETELCFSAQEIKIEDQPLGSEGTSKKFTLSHLLLEKEFDSKEDLEDHLEELYASNEFIPEDVDFIRDEDGKEYSASITVKVEPINPLVDEILDILKS